MRILRASLMDSSGEKALSALQAAQAAVDKSPRGMPQPWSPELVQFLTYSVLGFGVLALILVSALLWRASADGMQILRNFGVLVIVCLSALLLITGYSNEQLTPIVGLFGAIAGYLLGKDNRKD